LSAPHSHHETFPAPGDRSCDREVDREPGLPAVSFFWCPVEFTPAPCNLSSELKVGSKEMSNSDTSLNEAIAAHQAGRLDEAQAAYEQILSERPDDPDALHFLGLVYFHRQDNDKAVALIERSIAQAPDNPHVWNNLGNILFFWNRRAEAQGAYRRVTEMAPEMAEPWYNIALLLRDDGKFHESVHYFHESLRRQPTFSRAYESLGMLHYRLGQIDYAAEVYRMWAAHEPNNPVALHMAAATSGLNVPERADPRYIERLFDKHAYHFDGNLKQLGYRAPELVTSSLAQHAARRGPLDILDAGCGTGLCGPLLQSLRRRLVGVDLSDRMLELARERGGYDELVVGELCAFMRSYEAQFDAVVSADTLVYFGALEDAFAAAHATLREGGLLVCTLEALLEEGADDYRLHVHGRYAHRENYARRVLAQAGFTVLQISREALRRECLQDVVGHLVVARRRSA
jgi:predicted TPR repeat methyltransferase